MNFDVIEAENAAEALEKIQDYHSELVLVLSDIVMPGSMNGIELKKIIEEKYAPLSVLWCRGTLCRNGRASMKYCGSPIH